MPYAILLIFFGGALSAQSPRPFLWERAPQAPFAGFRLLPPVKAPATANQWHFPPARNAQSGPMKPLEGAPARTCSVPLLNVPPPEKTEEIRRVPIAPGTYVMGQATMPAPPCGER
jgi:hypothetical protein